MGTTNKRYHVELTNSAKKDLKKLRSHRDQIAEALGQLEKDPLAGHLLQGTLAELRSLVFTVKGSGAFRAIYAVLDEDTICLVIIVGPHDIIYDTAERRVKALRSAGEI